MDRSRLIVLIILIINTIIALITLIIGIIRRDKQLYMNAFVILVCPGIGFLFYTCSELLFRIAYPSYAIDRDDISFSREVKRKISRPDYDAEVQTVPIEESLIASNENDRRIALLNSLKRGVGDNVSLIVQAVQNEDPETAHYAASAITNMNSTYLTNLKTLAYEYDKDPSSYGTRRAYTDYLKQYIESGILSTVEKNKYVYLYLGIMKGIEEDFSYDMTEADYRFMVDSFLELKDGSEALKYAQKFMSAFPGKEGSYICLIKSYYELGMRDDFFKILDQLKRSNIFISKDGLDLIRMFS